MISIRNAYLRAEFTTWRAELVRLQSDDGRDFLWNGDETVWKGSSPILFPLVGMLPENGVLIDGQRYFMRQHGFAPASEFTLVHLAEDRCTFRLVADDATRQFYPFDFMLEIIYSLSGSTLSLAAVVTNTGDRPMPYSFGFHPAFVWPLPDAPDRDGHYVMFQHDETAPIRRPRNGLLDSGRFSTPVEGKYLPIRDELFKEGALIFDDLKSQGAVFGSTQGSSLHLSWKNLPYLGLWTRPGAGFLCIEPWHGLPSPVGFDGELHSKPGILLLPAEQSAEFEMRIGVNAP